MRLAPGIGPDFRGRLEAELLQEPRQCLRLDPNLSFGVHGRAAIKTGRDVRGWRLVDPGHWL